MSRLYWRAIWPEPRRMLVAVITCSVLWTFSAWFSPDFPKKYEQIPLALVWMGGAMQWGLMISARTSRLAWAMLSQQMPGAGRVLSQGLVLNLLLGLLLPMVLLGIFRPQADLILIGGAMLLGWGVALLAQLMPSDSRLGLFVAVFMGALYFAPVGNAQFPSALWPSSTTWYWALALLVLALVAGLWAVQCLSHRRWKPKAEVIDSTMRMPDVAAGNRCTAPGGAMLTAQQRLRAIFSPELKGVIQEASWRNRLIGAACLGIAAGFLMWNEPDAGLKVVVAYGMVTACLLLVSRAAAYLQAERARVSQSLIAELRLLPGLPNDGQWLRGICIQILRGVLERVLYVGILFSLIGWAHGVQVAWLQWLWLYLSMIVLLSLAQALQVGMIGGRRGYWRVLEFIMAGLAVATSYGLFFGTESAEVILLFWSALLTLAGIASFWLYQRLLKRGAPYFS